LSWCLLGDFAFLPLHAAGLYRGTVDDQASVSDFVVSTYAPSICGAAKARQGFRPLARSELRALLIAESLAPGLPEIGNVVEEALVVSKLMNSTGVTMLHNINPVPSLRMICSMLPAAHVFHLACHGMQSLDPLKSHFSLRDGQLTIAKLLGLNLPQGMLAFLSACETAKMDRGHPDHSVHLAHQENPHL
jgi:CHAT domain-containing protein